MYDTRLPIGLKNAITDIFGAIGKILLWTRYYVMLGNYYFSLVSY